MKGKNLQPAIFHPARFSWKFDRNQKQTEFSITRPALQQILKERLWAEKATTRKKENYEWKSLPIKTSKGKAGNHLHTNMISKAATVRRAPVQDIGNAFENKGPAMKTIVFFLIYID